MKKLTVIVISYNFEKWIEKCLSSIVEQQTNFDFDVFVRDDNSLDSTREIIKNFVDSHPDRSKFKLFFEDENLGIHKNFELLIKNCQSQYISHIDGDDYFTSPDRLQKQVDFLDQNPEFIIHSTSFFHHNQDDTITPQGWWHGPVIDICSLQDIIINNYVGFGRTFRNLSGEFEKLWSNPNWLIFYHEDWFFNFFLIKYGKSFWCSEYPSGHYRWTGTGKMSSLSLDDRYKIQRECERILEEEYQNYISGTSS